MFDGVFPPPCSDLSSLSALLYKTFFFRCGGVNYGRVADVEKKI